MANSSIIDQIESGKIARLIPVVADSKKEERATSSLLASFMVIPSFADCILSAAGAPIGKRSKVTCYTEVIFKSKLDRKSRPDGLVVVSLGSKVWSALIESKIGNAMLNKEQVEEYLELAKEMGANAVITLSNQFATLPTHHPLPISKVKTRTVQLYHFSWLAIASGAILISEDKKLDDPEQAYILNELVRYLQHDSSGVTALTSMGKGWKDLCSELLQGAAINRKADYVEQSVASWQQLLRFLAIQLSVAIGKSVSVYLTRARANDPAVNFEEDVSNLLKNNCLCADFDVPNAASRVHLNADILRRTVNVSMKVDAPKDKARSTASINWFTRQLKGVESIDLTIRAYWPRRIPMTSAPLFNALEDPKALVPDGVHDLPTALEVVHVVDFAARFRGSKTFVEDVERVFTEFYGKVGQELTQWIPRAPKVKKEDRIEGVIQDVEVIKEPEQSVAPTHALTASSAIPSDESGTE